MQEIRGSRLPIHRSRCHVDPGAAHIFVMTGTANAATPDAANGLNVEFLNFIIKPIKVSQLRDSLYIAPSVFCQAKKGDFQP